MIASPVARKLRTSSSRIIAPEGGITARASVLCAWSSRRPFAFTITIERFSERGLSVVSFRLAASLIRLIVDTGHDINRKLLGRYAFLFSKLLPFDVSRTFSLMIFGLGISSSFNDARPRSAAPSA